MSFEDTKQTMKVLMGGRAKAYFETHMRGTVLVFDHEVSSQDW